MSHDAFLEIRRRRGFTLNSRNFVLLSTGRFRIQIRTGWTVPLLLRMSSVPPRKCLPYTYFRNVSPVTLPSWSSTDRHQKAGDVTRLNRGIPRNTTIQNPVARKRRCYITDNTNWGFQGSYVKCRLALILKYNMHTHTLFVRVSTLSRAPLRKCYTHTHTHTHS